MSFLKTLEENRYKAIEAVNVATNMGPQTAKKTVQNALASFKTKQLGQNTIYFYNEEDNTCFEVFFLDSSRIWVDVWNEFPDKELLKEIEKEIFANKNLLIVDDEQK